MQNNNSSVYNIKINDNVINSKELFEIISKEFKKGETKYDISLNGKIFKFVVKKNSKNEYEFFYNGNQFYLKEKSARLQKADKYYCYKIQ